MSPFESRVSSTMEGIFSFKVQAWFHLDIQEYELLMSIISGQNAPHLFGLLDEKSRRAQNLSFLNFTFAAGLPHETPPYLQSARNEFLDRAGKTLFPKEFS